MPNISDLFAKLAMGQRLTSSEIEEIRTQINNMHSITSSLSSIIDMATGRFAQSIAEFSGDITAHGGDVNANVSSTTPDARVNLQTQQVTRGAVWYDQSEENVVLQNLQSGKSVVLNTSGAPVLVYSATDDLAGVGLDGCATNPSYLDGYAILYFYSDGAGTDELRVRGKIGAVETQVTLANLSP